MQALLDFGSELNAITPIYVLKYASKSAAVTSEFKRLMALPLKHLE